MNYGNSFESLLLCVHSYNISTVFAPIIPAKTSRRTQQRRGGRVKSRQPPLKFLYTMVNPGHKVSSIWGEHSQKGVNPSGGESRRRRRRRRSRKQNTRRWEKLEIIKIIRIRFQLKDAPPGISPGVFNVSSVRTTTWMTTCRPRDSYKSTFILD